MPPAAEALQLDATSGSRVTSHIIKSTSNPSEHLGTGILNTEVISSNAPHSISLLDRGISLLHLDDNSVSVASTEVAHSKLHSGLAETNKMVTRGPSAVSCLDVSFSFSSGNTGSSEDNTDQGNHEKERHPLCTLPPAEASPHDPISSRPARRPATWQVEASDICLRTVNPIRKITDAALPLPSTPSISRPPKKLINLGQGDPTVFGHLSVGQEARDAVAEALASGAYNGYTPSFGLPEAREAVAQHLSSGSGHISFSYSPADVYITSGCGHSFQLCLEALSGPNKNVLLPRPGFPVYDCWCTAAGLEIKRYSLLPERNWEVDLEEVRELADENTVALLVCHPGNPCGNVFSKAHLTEILEVAESLKLPIISDEIYGGISFKGAHFTPTVSVAAQHPHSPSLQDPHTPFPEAQDLESPYPNGNEDLKGEETGLQAAKGTPLNVERSTGICSVPVFTISSISKTMLVPGWRLGWIAVFDPLGILKTARVLEALENRMQYTTLTCSLIQAALPRLLNNMKPEFFKSVNASLEDSLSYSLEKIREIPGLDCPSEPQGGMFLMVRIDVSKFKGFKTDIEWCRTLLAEESVMVIPGTSSEFPGWFRIVLSAPLEVLEDAWERISEFSKRHHR